MTMTLDLFKDFIYATQDRAFVEERTDIPRTYTKYTRKCSTENADFRSVTGVKLGPAAYTPLGGQSHLDEYAPGKTLIIKPKKLTIAVLTPHELETDMFNNGRINDDKVKFFYKMGSDMQDSHEWAWELLCTDFFKKGTSATPSTFWQGPGRDGLPFFSASHVTTKGVPVTWSNIMPPGPMNLLSLTDGVGQLEAIPDERGRQQGAIKRIGIYHGSYWAFVIPELLKSKMQPNSVNFGTVNALTNRDEDIEWVPILNRYMGPTDTTWGLINLDQNDMCFWIKEKPTPRRDVIPRTGSKLTEYYSRVATFFESAKCAVRNNGV